MNEEQWDKLLRIKTSGRDDSHSDQYRYPYEPTPYPVLERLADSGYIRKGNTLLDYGCGKGRADFFLSWQTRCRSIGVEYDKRIYEKAVVNQKTAVSSGRTAFEEADAEHFSVPENVDRIYFFNPFSIELTPDTPSRTGNSPKTGDSSNIAFFLGLFALSGAGVAGTYFIRRRKRS